MMNFTQIYNQYKNKIYRICLGYTNNTEEAKDIMQDTFIAVWKNLDSFRNEADIGTWIYRIATNNCLRSIEKKKRHLKIKHTLLQDNTFQPEENQEDKIAFLRKIIAQLPELERIIITLSLEDIKQEEIAKIIGLTHSNVRVKTHRIKQKLLKKFNKYGKL